MLDDELKVRKKELESAINDALSDSPRIGELIQDIRRSGYEVFLIIEATIGFSRHADGDRRSLPSTRLELNSNDERFLRSLKISPD